MQEIHQIALAVWNGLDSPAEALAVLAPSLLLIASELNRKIKTKKKP